MGESRVELIAWINDLLGSQYTKIEQCGTGAVYCQVIDSIFGDVQMNKVKVNARQDYEYLGNYKVLQKSFKDHQIDKPIPVDRLIKCKMQDNLEFMQWLKKFWDQNWGGQGYDAAGRAGAQARLTPTMQAGGPAPRRGPANVGSTARVGGGRTPLGGPSRSASASSANSALVQQLRAQLEEMTVQCQSLEKERDFYFDKLRDVELVVQDRLALPEDQVKTEERDVLTRIQTTLYSTEEGFEVPEAVEGEEEEGVLGDLAAENGEAQHGLSDVQDLRASLPLSPVGAGNESQLQLLEDHLQQSTGNGSLLQQEQAGKSLVEEEDTF